jgi:hypothetical protein
VNYWNSERGRACIAILAGSRPLRFQIYNLGQLLGSDSSQQLLRVFTDGGAAMESGQLQMPSDNHVCFQYNQIGIANSLLVLALFLFASASLLFQRWQPPGHVNRKLLQPFLDLMVCRISRTRGTSTKYFWAMTIHMGVHFACHQRAGFHRRYI